MNKYVKYSKINNVLCNNKKYYYCILEEDFYFAQKTKNKILNFYNNKNHYNIIQININFYIDWNKIQYEYQQKNLFEKKKIIIANIHNNHSNTHNIKNICKILQYNDKNIILILYLKNYKQQKNIKIFINLMKKYHVIIIQCSNLSTLEVERWIYEKIKILNLQEKDKIVKILLHYYGKNIFMLSKMIQLLKIINFSKIITIKNIEQIIEDCVDFNIHNWIYAIFTNNKVESIRILNFFKKQKFEISHLLRSLQLHLIYLLNIKNQNIYEKYLYSRKKFIFLTNHLVKIKKKLYQINDKQIYKAINILTRIELDSKKSQKELIWIQLKTLTIILQ